MKKATFQIWDMLTGLYLLNVDVGGTEWTPDKDEAMQFESYCSAVSFSANVKSLGKLWITGFGPLFRERPRSGTPPQCL